MRSRIRRVQEQKLSHKLLKYGLIASIAMGALGALAIGVAYLIIKPQLPDIEALNEIKLSVPLRIYSADDTLLAEFGQKKRTPLNYEQLPQDLVNAFIAAEDTRFFEHGGVDYRGLARAVFHLIRTGRKGQGGSTITMQVARNYFLSRKKTYLRKMKEIFLSWKMEELLSKEKIMELYLNKIYLGNRAYGVAAAAQVYYGKSVDELTLHQMAMIAGLPKAPSRYNPIVNPRRALLRRAYVLSRMQELGFIDEAQFTEANEAVDEASVYAANYEVNAPYLTEMVRDEMVKLYGEEVYDSGYKVYTTIDSRLQKAANVALRNNLMEYDRRHGYRGPIGFLELETDLRMEDIDDETFSVLDNAVADYPQRGHLLPGIVVGVNLLGAPAANATGEEPKVDGGSVTVFQPKYANLLTIPWSGIEWAKPFVDRNAVGEAPTSVDQVLRRGDIIYVERIPLPAEATAQPVGEAGDDTPIMERETWRLAQIPEVEGALVSLEPHTGAVKSLVGGFDFHKTKFNRVVQAKRQPGSNFKPFIYSVALEKCFTPASIINDSPIVIQDSDGNPWRPENDNGKFQGPLRLRVALTKSVNLVSIRLLQSIGVSYAVDYAKRFGIDESSMPRNLTLSLGTASVPPMSVVRGYAVFANGGYLVDPYFIERIVDSDDRPLYLAPKIVLEDETAQRDGGLLETSADGFNGSVNGALGVLGNADESINGNGNNAINGTNTEMEAMSSEAQVADVAAETNSYIPIVQQTKSLKPVISKKNVFLMTSIMRDVVKLGTGRRALVLNRDDLAGKTGTTNDQVDAWFSGFNDQVVTTAWVGFDHPQTLGRGEYGGRAALPMWIDYMREALKGVPEHVLTQPAGVSTVRIDPETGKPAPTGVDGAVFEYFDSQCLPDSGDEGGSGGAAPLATPTGGGEEQGLGDLF